MVLRNNIAKALDNGQHFEFLFLDFSKAFDKVPHPALLATLARFCINSSLKWFSKYLSNRKPQVLVRWSISTTQPVPSGVPQGSHLGPILFLLYINSLPDSIEHLPTCTPLIFADDTELGSSTSPSCNVSSLQPAVGSVMSWVRAVGGNFNSAKSVPMRFCKAEPPSSSPDLFMDGVVVPLSCAYRHLGVMLDSRLSYSAHIEGVTSRFRQRVVLLYYMAKCLSLDIDNKLYKGYVRPVVEYSSPLWHSRLTAHQSLTLERLQVRVARQLLASLGVNLPDGYRTSKSDLLGRVRWPSLTWCRHIVSMRLFHHFYHCLPAKLLDFGFVLSNSARRQGSILLPAWTSYVRSTVLYTAARCWNALPPGYQAHKTSKTVLEWSSTTLSGLLL